AGRGVTRGQREPDRRAVGTAGDQCLEILGHVHGSSSAAGGAGRNQRRQNVGVTRTSSVKISRRPSNIAHTDAHLATVGTPTKFEATSPTPGPRLFSVAATAEKADTGSSSVDRKISIRIANTTM